MLPVAVHNACWDVKPPSRDWKKGVKGNVHTWARNYFASSHVHEKGSSALQRKRPKKVTDPMFNMKYILERTRRLCYLWEDVYTERFVFRIRKITYANNCFSLRTQRN